MSNPKPNSRIHAARAFIESLDQLKSILIAEDTPYQSPSLGKDSSAHPTSSKALEEIMSALDQWFDNRKA